MTTAPTPHHGRVLGAPAPDGRQSSDVPTVAGGVAASTRERDRYIDACRAVALLRVVVYHATGFAWLTVLMPAMGIMFALAGTLVARSLDRSSGPVIRSRLRRLLPALWVFGAVAVPVTVWPGWGESLDEPIERLPLVWWLLPLKAPPGGAAEYGWAFTGVLWYLVTYVWFVIVSPPVLRIFRIWPRRTLAVALALPVLVHVNVIEIAGFLEFPIRDLVTYGCCWLLGFAHHDGILAKLPAAVFGTIVVALTSTAAVLLIFEGRDRGTFDINHLPLVNSLWSAAFVAVVLRLQPLIDSVRTSGGGRSAAGIGKIVDGAVHALNARAVTIYLWHFPSLFAARELLGRWAPERAGLLLTTWLVVIFTAVATLLVGWVEDLAARRPVRLLPLRQAVSRTDTAVAAPGTTAMRATARPPRPDLLTISVCAMMLVAAITLAAGTGRWPATPTATQSTERQPSYDSEFPLGSVPLTVLSNAGPMEGDQAADGPPIVLAGETFQRGVVVRAPSALRLTPDGRCSWLTAVIGLPGDAANGPRVRFAVLADGVLLYQSPWIEQVDGGRVLELPISDVRRLDLTVESADDAPVGVVAAWADARLRCRS